MRYEPPSPPRNANQDEEASQALRARFATFRQRQMDDARHERHTLALIIVSNILGTFLALIGSNFTGLVLWLAILFATGRLVKNQDANWHLD